MSLYVYYTSFVWSVYYLYFFFFFSSRRRHTRCSRDWSSDVCSSDLPDAAQREVAELEREVARAQDQGDGRHDQVLVLREVHAVVHPDLGAGHGDQAEHHDGHAAHHGQRDRLDQRAELGREAQQHGQDGGHEEHGRRVDARGGHH